jgi:hypothetical protein
MNSASDVPYFPVFDAVVTLAKHRVITADPATLRASFEVLSELRQKELAVFGSDLDMSPLPADRDWLEQYRHAKIELLDLRIQQAAKRLAAEEALPAAEPFRCSTCHCDLADGAIKGLDKTPYCYDCFNRLHDQYPSVSESFDPIAADPPAAEPSAP